MKKIIMVCSIFVLLLALSVPTFAASDTLIGEWVFNSNISSGEAASWTVNGTVHLADGTSLDFDLFSTGEAPAGFKMKCIVDGTNVELYDHYRSTWLQPVTSVVFYEECDELLPWFQSNATYRPLTCDGSSCPATDANYDGVCDDCGYALTMSIRPYPSIDGLWDKSVYPYGLLYMRNDNVPSLYFLDNPLTTTDGVDFRFNGGNFVVYNLVDGVWTFEREGRGAVEFPDLDSGQILKVSHDVNFQGAILMNKDSDFFPTPLWETVEAVTQGAMTEEIPKMGGTMTILVACGVGLMACLVVLSLFGKRSLISLR